MIRAKYSKIVYFGFFAGIFFSCNEETVNQNSETAKDTQNLVDTLTDSLSDTNVDSNPVTHVWPELPEINGTPYMAYEEMLGSDLYGCCGGFPVRDLSASSTLVYDSIHKINYKVENIDDGEAGSAWIEGADGSGIGEMITFTYDYDYQYSQSAEYQSRYEDVWKIVNGYQKSESAFFQNNRIKKLLVRMNGEDYCYLNFEDKLGVFAFDLSYLEALPKSKGSILFELILVEVYAGTAFDDTVLSEIYF